MGTKTFITPITIHDGEFYRAPGSEVTLDEREADRIIALHGEFGKPSALNDPGNTNVLNAMDRKSIEDLNTFASINGGHGENARNAQGQTPGEALRAQQQRAGQQTTRSPLPEDNELNRMSKSDLETLASERGVSVEDGDTRAEIIAKLKGAK